MESVRVLSLFDGISCGMVALNRLGMNVTKYTAYEIDENAIKVSEDNWKIIEHKGDVFNAEYKEGEYDLLIGGSPCTYWSISRGGNGRETTSSGFGWQLFCQYIRALKEAKPRYYLYENNASMSDDIKAEITKAFGHEPIELNSADFSAQTRHRYYWTNIPLGEKPKPCTDTIQSIIYDNTYKVKSFEKYKDTMKVSSDGCVVKWDSSNGKNYYSQQNRARKDGKANTVTSCGRDKCNIWLGGTTYRYIHPIEAERLQTLPDNYTKALKSDAKRIYGVGNGWTVKVIEYLLSGLKSV